MSDEKPKIKQDIPDDGLVHLHDMSFDFEDYFERHGTDRMSKEEEEEFSARVYGVFCRSVFQSGGDPSKISFWAANYVAEKLYQALGGVPWQDIMGLPWDEPTPWLTTKGQRALDIFAGIENTSKQRPDANVTDLISEQAKKHSVSYETARADYYAIKKGIEQNNGIPHNFLNRIDDI